MNIEAEQELFEAWIKRVYAGTLSADKSGEFYTNDFVSILWTGWWAKSVSAGKGGE
jgi:hypothetical protein